MERRDRLRASQFSPRNQARAYLPIVGRRLDVRRGTGILPVGLCQAIRHGQDAHATRATVNRQMRPSGAEGDLRRFNCQTTAVMF